MKRLGDFFFTEAAGPGSFAWTCRFHEWPDAALQSVANHFLRKTGMPDEVLKGTKHIGTYFQHPDLHMVSAGGWCSQYTFYCVYIYNIYIFIFFIVMVILIVIVIIIIVIIIIIIIIIIVIYIYIYLHTHRDTHTYTHTYIYAYIYTWHDYKVLSLWAIFDPADLPSLD